MDYSVEKNDDLSLSGSSALRLEHVPQVHSVHGRTRLLIERGIVADPEVDLVLEVPVLQKLRIEDYVTVAGVELAMQRVVLKNGVEVVDLPDCDAS